MRSGTQLEHRSECETASPEIQHKLVWPNEERNVNDVERRERESERARERPAIKISLIQQPSTRPGNKRNKAPQLYWICDPTVPAVAAF
jgi:hypothetical protein